MGNRSRAARIVAGKIGAPLEIVERRMLGEYENGLGRNWHDPDHMKFYRDGETNFPYLSDGMWFLTQLKRWGFLREDPDYLAVAQKVNRIDLYREAAAGAKVPVPADPMRASTLIDGRIWDGRDPAAYAGGFEIRA